MLRVDDDVVGQGERRVRNYRLSEVVVVCVQKSKIGGDIGSIKWTDSGRSIVGEACSVEGDDVRVDLDGVSSGAASRRVREGQTH